MIDKFIMNADATSTSTGNINSDDATPDSDAYYLSEGQDGLRHRALVDNTDMAVDINADLTSTLLASILVPMGKYAAEPGRVPLFTEIGTYLKDMRLLDEVITIDKFGPEATIRSGQVSSIFGHPVLLTEAVGKTEADGKISATASNNTKGQIVAAHDRQTRVGFKRSLMLEMVIDPVKRAIYLIASFRIAVGHRGTKTSQTHVAVGYNITI